MIYGRLGKDSVIESVSTISNVLIKGYGILVWIFVINGRLEKDLVMEALSTIRNFVIT